MEISAIPRNGIRRKQSVQFERREILKFRMIYQIHKKPAVTPLHGNNNTSKLFFRSMMAVKNV
jgi:hypothetical protein